MIARAHLAQALLDEHDRFEEILVHTFQILNVDLLVEHFLVEWHRETTVDELAMKQCLQVDNRDSTGVHSN